jgi:hypothetical protein
MVVCSFAGGGVGKLEREPQDAKYRSNSSSVMSLVIENAGESSILKKESGRGSRDVRDSFRCLRFQGFLYSDG